MRRTWRRLAYAQRDTPVLPPRHAVYDGPLDIAVGYLLCRPQVVHHAAHPLETEMSYVLEREHKTYSRHEKDTLSFFGDYSATLDLGNRTDPAQITRNFFQSPAYDDAVAVVAQKWKPAPRITPADFADPFAPGVPQRHTLSRALSDYLYLIVRDEATGAWTVPSGKRRTHEPLRATMDRVFDDHHGLGNVTTYCYSNAPQAVLLGNGTEAEKGNSDKQLYVYVNTYCRGRPSFDKMGVKDHAWVTRRELCDYAFAHPDALGVLQDITFSSSLVSGDVTAKEA